MRSKLKNLINQSGKSVYQVQTEAGMNSGSLYRFLDGKTKEINLRVAFKLADALGVDVNEFREETDNDQVS
ncbi:helix-turn-helix domain-containing protein [Ignavigranum ruoffiae]